LSPDLRRWGNIDPVGVLAHGREEQVKGASLQALEAVRATGHRRFLLSSGCTLAMETPARNLEARQAVAQDLPFAD
jgi:uroporphyrinogen-III decarboxylase